MAGIGRTEVTENLSSDKTTVKCRVKKEQRSMK